LFSDPFHVLKERGLHNSFDELLPGLQGSDPLSCLPALPDLFYLVGFQEAHLVEETPEFPLSVQYQSIPVFGSTPPKINQRPQVLDEGGDQAGGKALGLKRAGERLPLLQLSCDRLHLFRFREGKELKLVEDKEEARQNRAKAKEENHKPSARTNLLALGWQRDYHCLTQAWWFPGRRVFQDRTNSGERIDPKMIPPGLLIGVSSEIRRAIGKGDQPPLRQKWSREIYFRCLLATSVL
jgi:hypothetical protein